MFPGVPLVPKGDWPDWWRIAVGRVVVAVRIHPAAVSAKLAAQSLPNSNQPSAASFEGSIIASGRSPAGRGTEPVPPRYGEPLRKVAVPFLRYA